jgi:RNA polymerase sigma factor (sigma-70 family)
VTLLGVGTKRTSDDAPDLGDRAVFAAAYRRHGRPILLFLTRRTYDAEVALDLTAETFARAYAGRRKFRGRTDDDLEAWLFGIARNVLARYIRRGVVERRCLERLGVEVPTMTHDEITRVNELAGLSNLRRAVAEEFAALADDQRSALQLRVIDELDYREVARRLDVPEATARARVSRGLKTLANALDQRQLSKEIPL